MQAREGLNEENVVKNKSVSSRGKFSGLQSKMVALNLLKECLTRYPLQLLPTITIPSLGHGGYFG
jgi:hypothetical protein